MIRRIVPTLLLALLVVTAGCTGGGDVDSGSTPASDSGDGSSVGGSGGGSDETGAATGDGGSGDETGAATGDGGSGDTALVENRTAALQAVGSYTSDWRMRALEEGHVSAETRYTLAMDYDTERYSFAMKQTDNGTTRTSMAAYYSDGRGYQRIGEGDETTYYSSESDFGGVSRAGWMSFGPTVSDLEDLSYEGTETYDGVQVRRYVLNRPAAWIATGGQTGSSGIDWNDFSYEVLVDEQGLVRSEHWSGTGVDETGTERSIEFSYELSGVGDTDVTEPAWLAQVDV